VGRFDPLKGHDILLEAWQLLGARANGWTLRLVGDGPQRENYGAFIHRHGLRHSVELAGFTNDIASEYERASIFVLPSRAEGFPNVLLEAMAMGLAVVVSDRPPACREVVKHEVNGLLYNGESVEALAGALGRMMDDDVRRTQLGNAAIDVRDRYSEKRIFALWEECLKDATG
jgi:glycosyltransferase involved in cell wall biosynthesis